MNKLPFVLEKKCGTTLIKQIVDGFRHAIEIGVYSPGDKLPPFRDISRESGACMIVVREAFKRLAAEGLVSLRRGVGSIVLDSDIKFWRGHIVIASVEVRENHLISAMTGALRQSLMKAGYLVSFVPFGGDPGEFDYTHLETVLHSSVSLVVATTVTPKLEQILSRNKVPYVVFGHSDNADGCVQLDSSSAVESFTKRCLKANVKKVIEVYVGSREASVSERLKKAGIACEKWMVLRKGGIEDICRATLKAFRDRLKKEGRSWIPDVLYFNDNFASQCALLSLVEAGVRIPEDVRFVTWSNAGEGPFWHKSLSRVEINPFDSGKIFAEYVLRYLKTNRKRRPASIKPVFIPADTFPINCAKDNK